MKAMNNSFYFKELSPDDPFCDREKELRELTSYAQGRANVVIFSPRRFGKTSLVKRVQKKLADKGAVTIFADFFGATSVDDIAHRLAKSVFDVTKLKEPLFQTAIKFIKSFRPVIKPDEMGGVSLTVEPTTIKKSGFDVLEDTLLSIGKFIEESTKLAHIALDEFQEIVQIQGATQIEGLMRSYVQKYHASCFFIGSRRRILVSIFNDRQRPFFQSAINYELKALPHKELTEFISTLFKKSGKKCGLETAHKISGMVFNHPYYSQKLSFFIYEISGKIVAEKDINEAYAILLNSEKPIFEATLQGLALQQIMLLKTIAIEPTKSLFSMDYMKRHNIRSTGGMQGAIKKLSALDLIEQDSDKKWIVVDPVFCKYLCSALD